MPEPLDDTDATELRRDAGAVLQAGFEGRTAPEWLIRRLAAGELGGVALFYRNIGDPDEVAALCRQLRALAPDILIAVDEEGGDVTRIEVAAGSSYPGNCALGAVDDLGLTESVGRAVGRDLAALGINLNYAPVADVNNNPDNPVIGVRSFGADFDLVAGHTAAYVRGMESAGVAACAKHFPGHGDTATDTHLGLSRLDFDRATLDRHLEPFRAAIEAGVRAIMTAHLIVPLLDSELPATMSPAVLTGLLRDELGYDGLIITDGIDMGAISGTYGIAEGTIKAIAAGADAICMGGGPRDEEAFLHLRDSLVWAVREGRIPRARLREAAQRNRAVARWSAAHRLDAEPAEEAGGEVTGEIVGDVTDEPVGLIAARRAIAVYGELKPLTGPAHVIEFAPLVSVAVDLATTWGLAAPLTRLLPGTTAATVGPPAVEVETVGLISTQVAVEGASVDVAPLLPASVGRALALVVRDLHRHRWMQDAVAALIAERPDAVVVEMGLPYGLEEAFADRGVTALATYGAARVCGLAAARVLVQGTSAGRPPA
jgi:beta-N-acetylhexosaminidase